MAKPKIVICALSGGVDSSVACALLKQQGFRVIGVFMKNWSGDPCPWEEDWWYVRRTGALLGIPAYAWDFEEVYREEVLSDFLREYQAGRTPNPDVLCNERIKFGAFLDRALACGADYIATGHYCRVERDEHGVYHLLRGVDSNKDQSYFLYRLGQQELSHALFPIGGYTKPEVRALAEKFGLPTAKRKDSQGICFIGKLNVKEYLGDALEVEQGEIITQGGAVVGTHSGIQLYTIGERAPAGGPGPYFVISKDERKNQLVVTTDENDPALYRSHCTTLDPLFTSLLRCNSNKTPQRVSAQPRYRSEDAPAELFQRDRVWETRFQKPQRALTVGQSVVWYNGEEVVGGGVINEVV